MPQLLCTAHSLLPAPVRQLYVAQLRYLLLFGGLNSFFLIFFFYITAVFVCFAQNRIINNMVRRFLKSGDFSIGSPVFGCRGSYVKALP